MEWLALTRTRHPLQLVGWWLVVAVVVVVATAGGVQGSCSSQRERIRWRLDGRCGPGFPLGRHGEPAQCDPGGERPCCSDYGYCGSTPAHCRCLGCQDYRKAAYEPSCHFVLSAPSGMLQSPQHPLAYPVSRDCCYDIARPDPSVCGVALEVEAMDVGLVAPGGDCATDYLSLPSCAPETGTRLCGNESGAVYEYLYQPGAESIRFVFHTDDIRAGHRGFRIRYYQLSSCPGPYQTQAPPISTIPGTNGAPCYTRINDVTGTINSPYFPKFYPENLDCVYEFIRTSERYCGVRMRSLSYDTAPSVLTPFGGACTDFLHMPSCGFLCGDLDFSWLVEYQPGATSLRFHFHSDEDKGKPGHNGFRITFEQVTEC